jgi:hypothetical protein
MRLARHAPYLLLLLPAGYLAGCSSEKRIAQEAATLPFAQQLALVESNQSERILAETPVTENELQRCAGLTNLGELLLDDPGGSLSSSALRVLHTLPKLWHLRIRGPGIDDAATEQLAKLRSLKILNVPHATFSDAGLKKLAQLSALEQLRFGSPHVTDAGLKALVDLPALKRLHLIDVPLTDAGLRELAMITTLESLYIDGAELSDAAIDELFKARPMLHIHFNQQHHDRDPHAHP